MDTKVYQVEEYITTKDAAKILEVSVYRIHHFLKDPCPDCGETRYQSIGDETIVTQLYQPGGCEYCKGTGVRLPTYGKFEDGWGWRLRRDDVEKLIGRKAGYPKGKKRRKKIRR